MINKTGKGPNLTWIFIGMAFAITVITLSMTSYNDFLLDNNLSISDEFNNVYNNISSEQSSIDSIYNEVTANSNVYDVVIDIGGGALNVFVTGLSSIGAFFEMGKMASSILNTTKSSIPGFNTLFGLLILISITYITMALIRARRGVSDIA